jgi:hypothetical protein
MDGHPALNSISPHGRSSNANRLYRLRQSATEASTPPAPTSNPKPQESDYLTMPVCVEDAEGLAELHAECWLHEGIVVLDEALTKQELIELAAARLSHILLIDTDVRRHELVIDNKTGQTLAYARWTLPESCAERWDMRRIPYIEPWERREYKEQHDKTSLPFDIPPELEAPRSATADADAEFDNVRLSARQRANRRSKQDPKRHAGGNPVRELEENHMPDRTYEDYISEIFLGLEISLIELGILITNFLKCSITFASCPASAKATKWSCRRSSSRASCRPTRSTYLFTAPSLTRRHTIHSRLLASITGWRRCLTVGLKPMSSSRCQVLSRTSLAPTGASIKIKWTRNARSVSSDDEPSARRSKGDDPDSWCYSLCYLSADKYPRHTWQTGDKLQHCLLRQVSRGL